MKILCVEYSAEGHTVVPLGDNVLLRNNGDFYMPGFTQELSCVPQLVVRLNRLGKSVSERFAGRYYNEIGVGVRFYADTLEEELQAKGLPGLMATSFDDSAAISGLKEVCCTPIRYSMNINEKPVFCGTLEEFSSGINPLVALASDFYTIKIGDYLFCGNPYRYRGIGISDRIQVYLDDECVLDFYVR